ncbi:NAD(P)H-quinone oxidoreductase [Aspergillus clavatus NRRL 1]|uniref:Quinone oxidoreductase, putative n=1 Tax=Aspergillus clavatus (strain ATCC 1007 / CBS 513.65 / DSM 816 / NCTC 3887 / NRRL 1 / QM 1276 / 107) TaxID=344612 RepID=A1CS86_ASPCL|nr:quinone oxidoreductase, putative [Aspergillus clavatus NRRL 1]EAW08507.1 quinone oxidoreductase, putative [Aspergillus clavatus NRRL 1]
MAHPKTMRAVVVRGGKGPADALDVDDIPLPTVSGNQALVRIKAFGLNRMDLLQREAKYPLPPQAPETLGVEFSGTIETLGPNANKDFKVGDEVFGLAYGGAYAQYIAVSTNMLIHKLSELSWEEAAGIPETWITATQALYLVGEYKPGQSVLWHAGASSVSIAGIQLSKADGAKAIYVTAGSQEKIDFCVKELGATAGFNYHTQDWSAEVLKATNGEGVNVIVDYIGANYFQGNLDAAAKDGHIVNLAFLGGTKLPEGVDISPFLRKRIRFEGSTLRSRDEGYQKKLRDTLVEHALPKFRDGSFKVFVEKVFPMEQIVEAHKLMETNQTKGKIICTVS